MPLTMCTGEAEGPGDMSHRADRGLVQLVLLLLWFATTASANEEHSTVILNSAHGPETRIVSNATDLGKALQDHMVTNIIIRGKQSAS